MAEDIAEVQSRHSDLRDDHLQESTKGREHAELVLVETEAGSSAEISALHDSGRNKDLRVLLVNDLETGGTLKIAYVVSSAHHLSLQETRNTYCR